MKYLSSSKLLRLQLQDAGLRRHFLLQVLIFLHAVRHVGRLPPKAAAPTLKDRQARPPTTERMQLYGATQGVHLMLGFQRPATTPKE